MSLLVLIEIRVRIKLGCDNIKQGLEIWDLDWGLVLALGIGDTDLELGTGIGDRDWD